MLRLARRFSASRFGVSDALSNALPSQGLLRILCAERFAIHPEFRPMPPQPERMFQECDAALIIGDATVNGAFDNTVDVPIAVSQTDGIQAIDLLIDYNTALLDLYSRLCAS